MVMVFIYMMIYMIYFYDHSRALDDIDSFQFYQFSIAHIKIFVGVHSWARLRPCGGEEIASAGWEGGARQPGKGGPLPSHPYQP